MTATENTNRRSTDLRIAERRFRLYSASYANLTLIFQGRLRLARPPHLPADAFVHHVCDDFHSNSLGIVMCSKEYEPVPNGRLLPRDERPLDFEIIVEPS